MRERASEGGSDGGSEGEGEGVREGYQKSDKVMKNWSKNACSYTVLNVM